MTKAEIVAEIANKTGIEKLVVQTTVEAFMESIKNSMTSGENVYLRGFGSFTIKKRAEKTGRNISKNTTIIIPAHNIPTFKPAKSFVNEVKENVNVKQKGRTQCQAEKREKDIKCQPTSAKNAYGKTDIKIKRNNF